LFLYHIIICSSTLISHSIRLDPGLTTHKADELYCWSYFTKFSTVSFNISCGPKQPLHQMH